jgi:ribosomal protein S18 acetylase RimI-like enzyme
MPTSLPLALADAHDTNYADFSTSYARRAGSDLRRDAYLDRAIIDLPALPFNGVFRSNLNQDAVAQAAEETLDLARTRPVPVGWRVTLTTQPQTSVALDALGWHAAYQSPVMARELAGLPTVGPRPDVRVEEVTEATLAEWSRVVAVAFGCPEEYVHGPAAYDRDVGLPGKTPLRRFLLRIDTDPVASSALLPGPTPTGLAGIFNVGTLERARGHGLGTIITHTAMVAARNAGAQVTVLQSSELGRRVYERLGFDTVGHITVHLPP